MTEQQAEPVACRFCHSKKGSWTWQCYKCGEIDDVQKPAPPPVQEPLTKNEALTLEALQYAAAKGYGLGGMKIGRFIIKETLAQAKQEDAFEGWVKIDEMRKHFDAVNCGTIYKDGGEGRVPLYTAPPQQQAEPPPEWLLIKNILDEYGLQALDFVAEFKAAQQVVTIWKQPKQQAPFSPEVINTTQTAWKMGYEAAKAEQQQAEPVAWDKPSASFDEWWDGDRRRDTANPFDTDSFAYWAFEGWQAALAQPVQEPVAWMSSDRAWMWSDYSKAIAAVANISTLTLIPLYATPPQRKWVGLTDEEIFHAGPRIGTSDSNVNPYQILINARAIEAKLKERNT